MNELQDLIGTTPIYVQMAILFGFSLLIAAVIVLVAFAIMRRTSKRLDSYTLDIITKRLRTTTFWVVALFLAVILWTSLLDIDGDPETKDPFYVLPAVRVLRTILYIFVALLVIRVVNVGADTVKYRFHQDEVHNLRERKILTQLQYIQRVIGVVVFLVTVAFILFQFPSVKSLGTGLFAGVGVGGIIIGLAAQKSISNLLAGFQIAFTQPIRIDDALIVNGEFGKVEEITLTYVTLKLWDMRRLIVPLNKFIDDSFQNWTRSTSQLIGSVFMYLDYTFPVPKLREEAERFVHAHELWDKEVFSVAVTDNNAEVMTVRILSSSDNSGNTFTLRCAVREHLISWIQKNYPEHLPKTRVELGGGGAGATPVPT